MNNQTIEKKCPRCGKSFICNPNNVANCQCSKVILNENSKKFLKENYNNCLCINCLIEINLNTNNL